MVATAPVSRSAVAASVPISSRIWRSSSVPVIRVMVTGWTVSASFTLYKWTTFGEVQLAESAEDILGGHCGRPAHTNVRRSAGLSLRYSALIGS